MVPLNLVLNIYFVGGGFGWPGWGVRGSAVANVLARYTVVVLMLSGSLLKGYHLNGWGTYGSVCRGVITLPISVSVTTACAKRTGAAASVARKRRERALVISP
jgi:hypothetical protein